MNLRCVNVGAKGGQVAGGDGNASALLRKGALAAMAADRGPGPNKLPTVLIVDEWDKIKSLDLANKTVVTWCDPGRPQDGAGLIVLILDNLGLDTLAANPLLPDAQLVSSVKAELKTDFGYKKDTMNRFGERYAVIRFATQALARQVSLSLYLFSSS